MFFPWLWATQTLEHRTRHMRNLTNEILQRKEKRMMTYLSLEDAGPGFVEESKEHLSSSHQQSPGSWEEVAWSWVWRWSTRSSCPRCRRRGWSSAAPGSRPVSQDLFSDCASWREELRGEAAHQHRSDHCRHQSLWSSAWWWCSDPYQPEHWLEFLQKIIDN